MHCSNARHASLCTTSAFDRAMINRDDTNIKWMVQFSGPCICVTRMTIFNPGSLCVCEHNAVCIMEERGRVNFEVVRVTT